MKKNSFYSSYQLLDTQMWQKGQFCIVLTLLPHLHAFGTKEYLYTDSTAITASDNKEHCNNYNNNFKTYKAQN